MPLDALLLALAGFTFLAVIFVALTSKKKTEDAMDDPKDPKSALAKDGPTGELKDRV
ncbi:MAG: hypothetical protein AAF264_07005 [Pseudomonadota bacterium]